MTKEIASLKELPPDQLLEQPAAGKVIEVMRTNLRLKLIPMIDMAYRRFSEPLQNDIVLFLDLLTKHAERGSINAFIKESKLYSTQLSLWRKRIADSGIAMPTLAKNFLERAAAEPPPALSPEQRAAMLEKLRGKNNAIQGAPVANGEPSRAELKQLTSEALSVLYATRGGRDAVVAALAEKAGQSPGDVSNTLLRAERKVVLIGTTLEDHLKKLYSLPANYFLIQQIVPEPSASTPVAPAPKPEAAAPMRRIQRLTPPVAPAETIESDDDVDDERGDAHERAEDETFEPTEPVVIQSESAQASPSNGELEVQPKTTALAVAEGTRMKLTVAFSHESPQGTSTVNIETNNPAFALNLQALLAGIMAKQ